MELSYENGMFDRSRVESLDPFLLMLIALLLLFVLISHLKESRGTQQASRPEHFAPKFNNGVSQSEFKEIVQMTAEKLNKRVKKRIAGVETRGTTIILFVTSASELTRWKAEIDFNDRGRVTGRYRLKSENSQSPIPKAFAENVREQVMRYLQ